MMRVIEDFPKMTFGERRAFCREKHLKHFNKLVAEFNMGLSQSQSVDEHLYLYSSTLPDSIVTGFLRRYHASRDVAGRSETPVVAKAKNLL